MAERKWREITVNTDSEVWDREEPIEGDLVKVEREVGPNKSMMYTLNTVEGEVKVWGSTVLDDKLMGVPQGSYVKLEYEGKLKSRKGAEYHSYKVFIDEATQKDKVVDTEEMPEDFLVTD